MCLSASTIILFNKKTISRHGGDDLGALKRGEISSLHEMVEMTSQMYGFDETEKICLAVYHIVKGHVFGDGNKRTATLVLHNCLRENGYSYTGRPKDLAEKIIELASSDPKAKREAVLKFSYFLKSRLQDRC